MFAIDHAATALLVKRRYPTVPIAPLLVAVQAMELAWVLLNYLGVERTTTGPVVRSVADIQLAYMPYSHSVATGRRRRAAGHLADSRTWGSAGRCWAGRSAWGSSRTWSSTC